MTDSIFTGYTLERIAIDHGIELLFLRDQDWLLARFESAEAVCGKIEVLNSDALSLLQALLHLACEVSIIEDGGLHSAETTQSLVQAYGNAGTAQSLVPAYGTLLIRFENKLTIDVKPQAEFEAWEMVSKNGDRWVCMPGGEVARWTAGSH